MIHLVDFLHEYGPAEYGSLRTPESPQELVTLAGYRVRHGR